MVAQDERLAAIAAAAATVLRQTPYHVVRAGDVAAAIQPPADRAFRGLALQRGTQPPGAGGAGRSPGLAGIRRARGLDHPRAH